MRKYKCLFESDEDYKACGVVIEDRKCPKHGMTKHVVNLWAAGEGRDVKVCVECVREG